MLQMISWVDYIKGVAFGLVLWYGYVGLKFFPRELAGLWTGARKREEADEDNWEEEEEAEEGGKKKDGGDGKAATGEKVKRERPGPGIERPGKEGLDGDPGRRDKGWLPKGEVGGGKATSSVEFRLTGGPVIGEGCGAAGREPTSGGEPSSGGPDPSLLSIAQTLSGEIKTLVEKAAADKTVKGELIFALQGLLDSEPYRVLKKGPFKEGINNLVRVEAETKCSIHLDAEELNGLWVR
jgi:hypothetical protein